MAELIYWRLELTMQVACEISTSGNHEREAVHEMGKRKLQSTAVRNLC
jgi:hypothetical protein